MEFIYAMTENEVKDFVILENLFDILETKKYPGLLQWGKSGLEFLVIRPETFNESKICKDLKILSLKALIRLLMSYQFVFSETKNKAKNTILIFSHRNFRSKKKDLLELIQRKSHRNTLQTIKNDQKSPSVFNMKVIECLKKLLDYFRIISNEKQNTLLSKLKKLQINKIKFLIYEKMDYSKEIAIITENLRLENYLVDVTFLYNEFDIYIRTNQYEYVIIDVDLYEIFQTLSFNWLQDSKIILTSLKKPVNEFSRNDILYKPYDVSGILSIAQIK